MAYMFDRASLHKDQLLQDGSLSFVPQLDGLLLVYGFIV